MNIPKDLRYTREHEWVRKSSSSIVVGVTDHAQSSLGDVVYLELPAVGRILKKGETFGVVESIKAVSDLYSPVDGKVIKINEALKDNPSQINQDCYDVSWMIEIEVSQPGQLEDLLDAGAYTQYVETLH